MKLKSNNKNTSGGTLSRRTFINRLGATTAGLLIAPYVKSGNILAYDHMPENQYLAQVALTGATGYERSLVRGKMEHLFEALGDISDVIRPGDKVALKINLVGGSGNAYSGAHQGRSITETMWTHPEVLRAVGELIIDAGVNPEDLYIVEALWDDASYNNFGYRSVQEDLGAQFVDLDKPDPYNDFMVKETGPNHSFYESFTCNRILDEVDVYVSIAKMKQHYQAGVTHSIKNQVGIVPKDHYTMPSNTGNRSALHFEGGNFNTHLPRSICDLFFAVPVNLAIIDGIRNAEGGEGTWNPTFVPADYNVLIAGKDPVATDSVASYLMGNDPEADGLQLPGYEVRDEQFSDNYLKLLSERGAGTNKMSEIQLVGDGAGMITSVRPEYDPHIPDTIKLSDNWPNPFNSSTSIRFYLPEPNHVTIKVYTVMGQEVETLVDGIVPEGSHDLQWAAHSLASGMYIITMIAGDFRDSKRMLYQK
jgi:uncharacterized protein (DUF362 family)